MRHLKAFFAVLSCGFFVVGAARAQPEPAAPEPAPAEPAPPPPAPAPPPATAAAPAQPAPAQPTPPPGAGYGQPAPGQAPPPGYGQPPPPGYAQPAYGYQEPPPPTPVQDPTIHYHDGFYLRLGLGIGYFTTTGTIDPEPLLPGERKITGTAIVGELLLGGTPTPGFVIGGGSMGASVPSAKLKVDGQEVTNTSGDSVALSLLGLFVDVYPDPAAGLHFQGMVGFAQLSSNDNSTSDNPSGIGLAVGVGHEWWVGEQWGFGVMGRLMYASTKVENGGFTGKYSTLVPGLLFTATLH